MAHQSDFLAERLSTKVAMVAADEASIGLLSTGEAIAVALVLNRIDLLPASYDTVLEAVDRLEASWLKAALAVSRGRR